MTHKGRIVFRALFAFAALFLTFDQAQAQLQPASSQTDFYFAHITDGGPDSGRWTTEFRFVNPDLLTSTPATGTLRFFTQNGEPLTVDFGTVSDDFFSVDIPPGGSVRFETKGTSPDLNVGFVRASFDSPIQATAEFRVWRHGVFANGASVNGIAPNARFWTFADAFKGIAVANPNPFFVSCTGRFRDSHGNTIREATVSLPAFNHKAFTLGSFLSLPQDIEGSYRIDCPEPVVSLAIAGNNKGITSSLPSGHFAFPANHRSNIQKIFKHLVKNLNSPTDNSPEGWLPVGQPRLVIENNQIINAFAGNNTVTIELALAELLADSPSELAFAIAHELGHIYQALNGLTLDPAEPEIDADLFATLALVFSGYDPYGGGGVLGKLGMTGGRTDVLSQFFDNLDSPHTSFSNRLGRIFEGIESTCSSEVLAEFCRIYHDIVHPHLPTPLRNPEEGGKQ